MEKGINEAIQMLLKQFPVVHQECQRRSIGLDLKSLSVRASKNLEIQIQEDEGYNATPNSLIEIRLSPAEIYTAFALGTLRTWFNEDVMGWRYRHSGLDSERAHSIGQLGEIIFEKILKENNIPYMSAPAIVSSKSEFRQDIDVRGCKYGVKTASFKSFLNIFRYGGLYPAKIMPGESLRVLSYPDYLVQIGTNVHKKKGYFLGAISREQLMACGVVEKFGKPAHVIPLNKYEKLDFL